MPLPREITMMLEHMAELRRLLDEAHQDLRVAIGVILFDLVLWVLFITLLTLR